jgi:hypothetical protein
VGSNLKRYAIEIKMELAEIQLKKKMDSRNTHTRRLLMSRSQLSKFFRATYIE